MYSRVKLCRRPPNSPYLFLKGSKGFGMDIDLFVVSPRGILPGKFG